MPPMIMSPSTMRELQSRVSAIDRDTSKVLVRKARGGGGGGSGGSSDLHLAESFALLPVLTTDEIGHRGFVTETYVGPYIWDGAEWQSVQVFYAEKPAYARDGDMYIDNGVLKVTFDTVEYFLSHTRDVV